MITEDKNVAVRVLKSLWVLWEKNYDNHWPSQESVQEFHEFITKNGKFLGITDSWDDLGFWYNAMILNEDNIYLYIKHTIEFFVLILMYLVSLRFL
jgi:hypothetical protein